MYVTVLRHCIVEVWGEKATSDATLYRQCHTTEDLHEEALENRSAAAAAPSLLELALVGEASGRLVTVANLLSYEL